MPSNHFSSVQKGDTMIPAWRWQKAIIRGQLIEYKIQYGEVYALEIEDKRLRITYVFKSIFEQSYWRRTPAYVRLKTGTDAGSPVGKIKVDYSLLKNTLCRCLLHSSRSTHAYRQWTDDARKNVPKKKPLELVSERLAFKIDLCTEKK